MRKLRLIEDRLTGLAQEHITKEVKSELKLSSSFIVLLVVTDLSQIAQDFPIFRTESPVSQETPSVLGIPGWLVILSLVLIL